LLVLLDVLVAGCWVLVVRVVGFGFRVADCSTLASTLTLASIGN